MSKYDDEYSELQNQLHQLCNTLPVANNKNYTLTKIGTLSLRLSALEALANDDVKPRFPWCFDAARTNLHSRTHGAFRPSGIGPGTHSANYRWMTSGEERKQYSAYYRCPCDNDNNEHWHKAVCIVTYDDWGDGPQCNLCGELITYKHEASNES